MEENAELEKKVCYCTNLYSFMIGYQQCVQQPGLEFCSGKINEFGI